VAAPTTAGRHVLSVSLLQDVAAIPILALLPLLAVTGAAGEGGGWLGAAKALGVILAIVFGGRLLLRPALRWIARSDTPEIFTAAALLLVVATAALMHGVSLSSAGRLPGRRGVGHGAQHARAPGRAAGVRDPAGPGRRVRLRGHPDGAGHGRDRA